MPPNHFQQLRTQKCPLVTESSQSGISLCIIAKVDLGFTCCFRSFPRLARTVFLAFSCPLNLLPPLPAPPWLSDFETPHWEREQKSTQMPVIKMSPVVPGWKTPLGGFSLSPRWTCKSSALWAANVGYMHRRGIKHPPKNTHCCLKTHESRGHVYKTHVFGDIELEK